MQGGIADLERVGEAEAGSPGKDEPQAAAALRGKGDPGRVVHWTQRIGGCIVALCGRGGG